jgi:hypothetical protein
MGAAASVILFLATMVLIFSLLRLRMQVVEE